jgi:hypothetical protein
LRLDAFLERLENTRHSGNGWTARCPAHDDRIASLGVAENGNKLLVTCHAGCPTESVVEAMGLTMRDLFYDSFKEEPEAVYEYTDEHGELLYEALRFPGKKFKQRRCDPETREMVWGLDGVHRVLYRLPEVVYAAEQGRTIYVCEGEKDVDALRAVGKAATCNSGGAGSWKPDYADYLRGARVIIVADKDEPGTEARGRCRPLARGHRPERARRPGQDGQGRSRPSGGRARRRGVHPDHAGRHAPPLPAARPVPACPRRGLGSRERGGRWRGDPAIADGGAGKSFFALALSLAVAGGLPFLGCAVKQGRSSIATRRARPTWRSSGSSS